MEKKLIGLVALILVVTGCAEEFAADVADNAGEFLEDAGEALSDAGTALADAGRTLVDAGAYVDSGAQAMQPPADDETPIVGKPVDPSQPMKPGQPVDMTPPVTSVDSGSTTDSGPRNVDSGSVSADAGNVAPTPPAALIVNTTCSAEYSTARNTVVTREYYAEVLIGQQDPRTFTGATAWMCDYEVNGNNGPACNAPGCIANPPPQPTCIAGVVEVTERNSGGTWARVKCGTRFTDPTVSPGIDLGYKYKNVKITIAL